MNPEQRAEDRYKFAKEKGLPFVFTKDQLIEEIRLAKPGTTIIFIDDKQLAWSFAKNDFRGIGQRYKLRKRAENLLVEMKKKVGVYYAE